MELREVLKGSGATVGIALGPAVVQAPGPAVRYALGSAIILVVRPAVGPVGSVVGPALRGNYDDNDIDNYHDNVMNKAKTIRMKIMTPSPIK